MLLVSIIIAVDYYRSIKRNEVSTQIIAYIKEKRLNSELKIDSFAENKMLYKYFYYVHFLQKRVLS